MHNLTYARWPHSIYLFALFEFFSTYPCDSEVKEIFKHDKDHFKVRYFGEFLQKSLVFFKFTVSTRLELVVLLKCLQNIKNMHMSKGVYTFSSAILFHISIFQFLSIF